MQIKIGEMKRITAAIDFSDCLIEKLEKLEKLDAIEQRIIKIEGLLIIRAAKDYANSKPIPQKTAMKDLEVSFPTFKKLCVEFRVNPIKRNGRLFYKLIDIQRILNGQK
jgi:hypothetical protein